MPSSAEKRLRRLERQIGVYRRRVDGWPYSHCDDGWISGGGDALRCDASAYLRYP